MRSIADEKENIAVVLQEKERELSELSKERDRNDLLIQGNKLIMEKLQKEITPLQDDKKSPDEWELSDSLMKSDILERLHTLAAHGRAASSIDWDEFIKVNRKYNSGFMKALAPESHGLTTKETFVCLLVKARFLPLEISVLLDTTAPAISNMRKRLLKKIFGIDGSAKNFDFRIRMQN